MSPTLAKTPPRPPSATPDVLEIELQAPPAHLITYNHRQLVSALRPHGVTDPACVIVETDGMSGALVTVYKRPPLETVPQVRPETDLVMDRHGYITVGRFHDGRPARRRLYRPGSGAQRAGVFGTTDAGKSRSLQLGLAAYKRSGIVSWMGDLKGGQSVPEAAGQTELRVTTPEGAVVMLQAALAVAEERMRRYAELGRSTFLAGRPDPLLNVTVDEVNRLLGPGCPYRDTGAHLISEIGRAGRSVGVGIEIAGQAAHIEELGGSDTLRAMIKEGDVVLLRWSSGMMASLVGDGLLPPGVELAPIPRTAGPPVLRSRFAPDADAAPGASTAGMAYLLGSDRPSALMRHFRVGSPDPETVDGLDPAIVDLYGPGPAHRIEEASRDAAGPFYEIGAMDTTGALDRAAVETFQRKAQQKKGGGGGGGRSHAEDGDQDDADAWGGAVEEPVDTGPRTASARILDALAAADGGVLTKRGVLDALAADGEREISDSRVAAALSELTRSGRITAPERGRYQLP